MKSYQKYSQKYPRIHVNNFSFIENNEIELEKRKRVFLKNLLDLYKNLSIGTMTFSYGGRPVRAHRSDLCRVLSEYSQNDSIDLAIRNIILNTLISLEATSPYSSSAFLENLFGVKRKKFKRRADLKDVESVLVKSLGQGICYKILMSIFRETGFNFDINIGLSDTKRNFSVVIEETLSLNGNIPFLFSSKINSIKQCNVLIIDGVVEKVSEIDSILRSASEAGENVVIMSRKFSPDVVNTLYQNFVKGNLKVIPFELKCKQSEIEDLKSQNIEVIDSENFGSLLIKNCEDLGDHRSVKFYDSKISISGLAGIDRTVSIEIPKHFHRQAGIIEDRLKFGHGLATVLAKYGVVLDENDNAVTGIHQYNKSKNAYKAFKKIFEDLGCVITQSV